MKIYKIWEVITMLLYEGKAKQVYSTDNENEYIQTVWGIGFKLKE